MSKKSQLPLKWILGGAIIAVAALAISNLKFGDNLVYFYTPDEVQAKAQSLENKLIKVGGMVKGGSVIWKPEDLALSFVVSDLKGHDIQVQHKGAPPDMFKEMSGVVVEGRLSPNGDTILSQKLMVKHSEEYKKPDGQHSMDKALLEKSIFKE